MKTTDNGGTFQGVFEKQAVAAIGAVAVAPSDPKVVWVGTGEANDRNSSGWGNGVYRSTDGGETWTHAGLQGQQDDRAHRRPSDRPGHGVGRRRWATCGRRAASAASTRRRDGGKTWKAVLQAPRPTTTGSAAATWRSIPPTPTRVYAALYARQRTPWSFVYGPGRARTARTSAASSRPRTAARPGEARRGPARRRPAASASPSTRRTRSIVYAIVQSDEGGTSGIDDVRSRARRRLPLRRRRRDLERG